MYKINLVILVILWSIFFSVNAKIIDTKAPHQFQPGEAANAILFNENMNNVYAATSDNQEILGCNDNTIIVRDSIADAITKSLAKNPSPTNIVKILLNPGKIYYLESPIELPSNVILASITPDKNGEEGAKIILHNNATIIMLADSKLFGVNILGNSALPLITIAGKNTAIKNSNVFQSGAAAAIKFNCNADLSQAFLSVFDTVIKNNASQANPTFEAENNCLSKVILRDSIMQNQSGFLTNSNSIKVNAIACEIDTNISNTNLNAIFSYQFDTNDNLKAIYSKN